MEAYATVSPGNPFAASKAMFAALADELAGPAAAGLTAAELEELVDEESRKAVLRLLQDHYDLRALREEQQARKHPGPVTGHRPDRPDPAGDQARPEAGHAVRHGDGDPLRVAEAGSPPITCPPTPPCHCRPGGTPIPWRNSPAWRRPAARTSLRTTRSPAAAGT